MPNSKQIVYLSQSQYAELIANGSITVDGVTVTYDENDIYVTPQAEPVTDVRMNGNSIAVNGVADIPMAGNNTLGLVRVRNTQSFGVKIDSAGNLDVRSASSEQIKNGTANYIAITPTVQDQSVFYGLAKASGDTTQSSSSNFVGTYTPEAKGAIQQMLGVSDLIAPAENNLVASKAYKVDEVFTANGKLYKATAAIAADTAIIPAVEGEEIAGANCEETSVGEGFPHDVQVNGVSVISEGVANIPEAVNNGSYGVVKISSGNGIGRAANGYLYVVTSTDAQVKSGTNSARPISPLNQHLSTFYGLAKAAGDTTQVASDNAVGTYTDEAKAAIKNMLGITHTLTVTVLTQDNVTVTGQTVTVRADNASGGIYATAAYEGQPVSFSVPDGFQYYVSVSDTLDHHFNPTTASGIVSNTDIAVTLQYSDFSTIRTAADIKAALNAGMDLTELVGEQITCSKGDDTLTWDVVDYDSTNGRIMLLLHDAFGTANMVFEPPQALMWCENGLAAGSYTFTWNTTQCYFTLTTAIPAGGQLRATNSQFQTYASQDATATLETGTVGTDEIVGATDLGHDGQGLLNHRDRVNYGSNNFAESALFWWLNSDAPAGTLRTPVTKFSRAHSYAQPGFLNGLDQSFINCLDEVDWLCSTNNIYECPEELGGYTKGIKQAYTVKAKISLASEMEIFGSYGGNSDGSTLFDLYNGAEADDRKKYRGTSAQTWWLRSPYWGNAYYERDVTSSGGANSYYASSSFAVVPAVRISATN